MLSEDLRKQLKEPCPFSLAVKYQLQEQNGNVIKVPHSNPPGRAKRELKKLKQDMDDLTLTAMRLDDEEKHMELFSDDAILSLLDAVLDISENIRRTTVLGRKEQQIIDEHQARWLEVNNAFDQEKLQEDEHYRREYELRGKEIFGKRDVCLIPISEAFQRERIPDPRRTELASRIAAMCLDYCSSQLSLAEPDLPTVQLFQEVLDKAKILTDSIAGKVRRFQAETSSPLR